MRGAGLSARKVEYLVDLALHYVKANGSTRPKVFKLQTLGLTKGTNVTIQADGQLFNAESYRKLVICYRNGAPVRLQDVADVYDSIENDKFTAYFMDAGNIRESVVLISDCGSRIADSNAALMGGSWELGRMADFTTCAGMRRMST